MELKPTSGNLKNFFNKWKKLTDNPLVLETVSGLTIEFIEVPIQKTIPREYHFNSQHYEIIKEKIAKIQAFFMEIAPDTNGRSFSSLLSLSIS